MYIVIIIIRGNTWWHKSLFNGSNRSTKDRCLLAIESRSMFHLTFSTTSSLKLFYTMQMQHWSYMYLCRIAGVLIREAWYSKNKAPKVQMPRWNDTLSTNTTIHHSTNTATADACIQDFCTAIIMQCFSYAIRSQSVLTTFNWACLQCLAQQSSYTHTTSGIAP